VKALRSLSEIGFTFLFAGSERMNVIYSKHALELNKWTNMFLDTIGSIQDRRDLITKPVDGQIEYDSTCPDSIGEYAYGNPFFIHLICLNLFERCVGERRTYVSDADFRNNRETLVEALGQTNFAHFWEDNPVLEREENTQCAAENCLALCCISSLGGTFHGIETVWNQQDTLNLSSTERISMREMGIVVERLRSRKVLYALKDGSLRLSIPIFRDWLQQQSELVLLPIWRRFVSEKQNRSVLEPGVLKSLVATVEAPFPVDEDELLSVSQNLIFCGKQKDVAEIKLWLKQFDDDSRIEIAFALLKRLSQRGFISDGARANALSKLVEGILARRLEVGTGKWNVVRARRDNLCLSYVDSELKSGASLAREMTKMMGPGKSGAGSEIGAWMASHSTADPMVVIVDDFSGTGTTLGKGLTKWKKEIKDQQLLERYLNEGRVMLVVMFALGQALDVIRDAEPRLRLFTSNTLGSDVMAFDHDAGIFDTQEEISFAREVMLQIGRELTPQTPIGFGDQALLVAFHNTIPNNTLPVFWSNGRVNEKTWKPLFSRI
jgi:hypothetical protein